MTIENELDILSDAIRTAKIEYAKLEGKEKALTERLKTDHNLDSVEDAEAELKKLHKDLESIDTRLNEKFTKLKEEFEW